MERRRVRTSGRKQMRKGVLKARTHDDNVKIVNEIWHGCVESE